MNQKEIQMFQESFGSHLGIPFDFTSGQFRIQKEKYDAKFCERIHSHHKITAEERVGAYNAQYWYRLLSILQEDFPLTAQLMGLWHFNQVATDYLVRHPSSHFDLTQISLHFTEYFLQTQSELHLTQAVQIDIAYHQAFLSPSPISWDGMNEDSTKTLLWNQHFQVIHESFELIKQRQDLDSNNEKQIPIPHAGERYWVIFRNQTQIHTLEIEADFYRLIQFLRDGLSLDDSLHNLGLEFDAQELAEKIPNWFQLGRQYQWWYGWGQAVSN